MVTDSVLAEALFDLSGARHHRAEAVELVAKSPGLYAFYGDTAAWSALDLVPVFSDQPLYVGKAERSLNGRDVGTHFSSGKTGSSTVRRSLAALLSIELELTAVPRNLHKPDGSANFALDETSEERLSAWMNHRLTLATWEKRDDLVLDDVETAVVGKLRPPLNLDKVGEPRERLRAARKTMADAARTWTTSSP